MMLVEMFSKIFFQNHIYLDIFENLTFRKFPAIQYFKMAFLKIKYVTIWLVFVNPVTFTVNHKTQWFKWIINAHDGNTVFVFHVTKKQYMYWKVTKT